MSYKKWIYKYQFLKEDLKDLKDQEQENIKKFNDDFDILDKKEPENNPQPAENLPPSKIPDNPGKPLYKILSKKLHPDKGGDAEEFAEVSIMYRNQNTIGLYLKAESLGVDVEEYLSDDLIKSFEKSCKKVEEECDAITGTISWVWCNADNELDKNTQITWIKKNLGLSPKKK